MQFSSCLRLFVWMAFLTGIAYPMLITLIAQISMGWHANGSLIIKNDQAIGSQLIAQSFMQERYFWPRPSSMHYQLPSGGSNLGPTSAKLKEEVEKRKLHFDSSTVPSELLYASGSGLDPHISIECAYFQMPRIAKERSMDEQNVKFIIDRMAEYSIFNKPYLNVLLINKALDDLRMENAT